MNITSSKDLTSETRDAFVADLLEKCSAIFEEHPENRCAKYAVEYLKSDESKSLSNDG